MKKVLIPIFLFLIIFYFGIIIYNSNKIIDKEFYSVKENHSYVYKENNQMTFNVYSKTKKPLIIYKDKNRYKLKLDSFTVDLANINIEGYDYDNYYLIKITSDIPYITDTEYISETFILEIKNTSYTLQLDMGSFSLLNPSNVNVVSLDYLKPTYSYIDNIKYLVALNIKFDSKYKTLRNIRIGGLSIGNLNKVLYNIELDNEVNIESYIKNYSILSYTKETNININNTTLLIPLGYIELNLVRAGYLVIELDNNIYYFDRFIFDSVTPSLKNKERGTIKNA